MYVVGCRSKAVKIMGQQIILWVYYLVMMIVLPAIRADDSVTSGLVSRIEHLEQTLKSIQVTGTEMKQELDSLRAENRKLRFEMNTCTCGNGVDVKKRLIGGKTYTYNYAVLLSACYPFPRPDRSRINKSLTWKKFVVLLKI